jgi:allophanate hydrolase subunit 2
MIVVQKPGLLASVQDLGRHGHRQLGICPGGALDVLALTLANRLVGNADGAAGLELTMGGCELRFETDTRIALAGDDFGAQLDGVPLWPCWSVPVAAGQVLKLQGANAPGAKKAGPAQLARRRGRHRRGARARLAQHRPQGRLRRPRRPSPAQGRQAAAGPVAPRCRTARAQALRPARPRLGRGRADGAIALRVLPGPEFEQFTLAARDVLWGERWRITSQSNRMGSRLAGTELKRKRAGDMLSSGVIPGTIQVPPSGQPIILMGDAQTTGGYPRIGVVIRADLWKLAQAPLNGKLRLVQVDMAGALAAWAGQQRYLAQVAQGLAVAGWPGAA